MLSSQLGADSLSKQISIQVAELPIVDAGPSIYINQGDTAYLQASGNAASYVWQTTQNLWPSSQIAAPKSQPDTTSRYWLLGTSLAGCINRDSMMVWVESTLGLGDDENEILPPVSILWQRESQEFHIENMTNRSGYLSLQLYKLGGEKIQNSQLYVEKEKTNYAFSIPQKKSTGMYVLVCEFDGKYWSQKYLIY